MHSVILLLRLCACDNREQRHCVRLQHSRERDISQELREG